MEEAVNPMDFDYAASGRDIDLTTLRQIGEDMLETNAEHNDPSKKADNLNDDMLVASAVRRRRRQHQRLFEKESKC